MLRTPSRTRNTRGFTLVEAVIALFIMVGLTMAVLATVKPGTGPGSDDAAKTSLAILAERQVTNALAGGLPLDATALNSTNRGSLSYTEGDSLKDTSVSVLVSGQVVSAAVRASTASCWLLRRDLSLDAAVPSLWAVSSTDICNASIAAALTDPGDGSGLTPARPVQL